MTNTKARFNVYNPTPLLIEVMTPEVCKDFMINLTAYMINGKIKGFTTKEAKIYFDSQSSLYKKQRRSFEVYLNKGNQHSKGVTPKKKEKPLKPVKKDSTPYAEIIDFFHFTCVSFPKVLKITETRKRNIKNRLDEHGKEAMAKVFKKANASDFLNARTSNSYQANIDFILNKTKFIRILEGHYDNNTTNSKKSTAIETIIKNRKQ